MIWVRELLSEPGNGIHRDGIIQASQSSPAVHIVEVWWRSNTTTRGWGCCRAGPPVRNSRVPLGMYLPACMWCNRDLDPWYQYNHLLGHSLEATDSWLRTAPPPFPCACHLPLSASHHLISMPISYHCLSYHFGHRTLMYNLRNSIVLSLRPILLVLGCRTPALPQDQVVAWRCSVHGGLRPPPTLIPFCNVNSPSLQLWRILYSQVDDEAGQTAITGSKCLVWGKGGRGKGARGWSWSRMRRAQEGKNPPSTGTFLRRKEGGGAHAVMAGRHATPPSLH